MIRGNRLHSLVYIRVRVQGISAHASVVIDRCVLLNVSWALICANSVLRGALSQMYHRNICTQFQLQITYLRWYSVVFIFRGPFVKVAVISSVLRLLLYSLFKFSKGLGGPENLVYIPYALKSVYYCQTAVTVDLFSGQ